MPVPEVGLLRDLLLLVGLAIPIVALAHRGVVAQIETARLRSQPPLPHRPIA